MPFSSPIQQCQSTEDIYLLIITVIIIIFAKEVISACVFVCRHNNSKTCQQYLGKFSWKGGMRERQHTVRFCQWSA